VATTVTSRTAARATSASAPPAITITIATAAGTPFARTFRTSDTRVYRRDYSVYTVEVRFLIRIELRAAFDHRCGCALRHRWR
jgi:hypothetical protein